MNKGLVTLYNRLTKSEKRYVSVSFDPVKQSNLVKIYESLSNGTDYKATHAAEYRLFEFILERLSSFHRAENIDEVLYQDLSKVKVLYMKGMFELCKKHLRKVKANAEKYERHLILQHIYDFEMLCFKDEGAMLGQNREELTSLYSAESKNLERLQYLHDLRYRTIDFLLISRNKIGPLSAAIAEEYQDIISNLDKRSAGKGIESEIYLSNLKGMFAFNEGNFKNSLKHFSKTRETINEHEEGTKIYAREYFFALNNILLSAVMSEQFDLYDKTAKHIHETFEGVRDFDRELFATTLLYETGVNVKLGRFKDVVAKEDEIVEGIETFEVNLINRQIYNINLAISFLAVGNYAKAYRYVILLINDTPRKRIKSDSNIYFYAHFLSLILLLEKEEFSFLKYSVGSTTRQLKKIRPLNEFDNVFISYISAISKMPEKKDAVIKAMIDDKKITAGNESEFAHQFFDFTSWLKAKLKKITMSEL